MYAFEQKQTAGMDVTLEELDEEVRITGFSSQNSDVYP